MRVLRIIGILLLLIGFPAVSWYYLQTGINWRKDGLAEVFDKQKVTIPVIYKGSPDGPVEIDPEGKFIILVRNTEDVDEAVLQGIYEQFDHRKDLLLLALGNVSRSVHWQKLDCISGACEQLERALFIDTDANCVFVDSEHYIRMYYDLAEEADVQQLVKHGAILFPVEKREQIELKRGSKQ